MLGYTEEQTSTRFLLDAGEGRSCGKENFNYIIKTTALVMAKKWEVSELVNSKEEREEAVYAEESALAKFLW